MSRTSPQPNEGAGDERLRIKSVVERRGLVGAANDTKWGVLLDAMRMRDGWRPSWRYKPVDGRASEWDVEWWCHLPFPMMCVEWFDIVLVQEVHRGLLVKSDIIDHSDWIRPILLDDARFCYEVVGDIARIFGYLPKSLDGLRGE